jgi:hypothetical protein
MEAQEENVYATINLGNNRNLNKKIIESPLKDYMEIKPKYLKFFFGNWVKVINKTSKEYNSGGFLTELNYLYKTVYLRNGMQSSVQRFYPIENFIYYVKKDTEHYRAYLNIKMEYDKLKAKSTCNN